MKTLLDLFTIFSSRADRAAIVYRTGIRRYSYSYQWLHDQSLKTAAWLASRGVKAGDRVVIWAPNSPWWVVSFWGAIIKGVVVVPVDFMSGRARAEQIAELVQAKLILQSQYKLDRLANGNTFLIENLEYAIQPFIPVAASSNIKPIDTAEIIYTSGTTGDPKGVVLSHGNIISNLINVNKHIAIGADFNFLSLLPLSHMFEQLGGFFTPLYRGGSIVYLRTLKPSAMMAALDEERIFTVMLVPRLLQALRSSIERQLDNHQVGGIFRWLLRSAGAWPSFVKNIVFFPIRRKFGRSFKFFVSGGAALDLDLAKFWQNMGFVVVEGYGLTECSPILTANTFEQQVNGSVGTIIPEVKLKLEGGELLAKGPSIFSGYYNNSRATSEAFTPDGWFKTGDLGTIDKQGNVFLKGRRKEIIVTSSGVNVYPDDIEPILNRLAGIREGCIIGLDRGEGEEVHAVLIPDASGRRLEEVIKELNSRLDAVQQVTGFSVWPELEFPKTTTLKVQKFRVKQLLEQQQSSDPAASQDKIVNIIAQVTGRPVAEIKESSCLVTDLGLTSIARLELVNYLEQEYRLDLDDSIITPLTTVSDFRQLVVKREAVKVKVRYKFWVNTTPIRLLRRLADIMIHQRIINYLAKNRVKGAEQITIHLGPVIFASNHVSYFDPAAILYALPPKVRYRITIAAGDEFFFEPGGGKLKKFVRRLMYEYISLCFNAFILPEKVGFREVVGLMGKLIDRGLSILYFPEGGLARPGKKLPYQLGLGLMVRELKVPVVPVKLVGWGDIIAPDTAAMKHGRTSVIFGQPLKFTTEQPSEIVAKIQQAVELL